MLYNAATVCNELDFYLTATVLSSFEDSACANLLFTTVETH